MTFSEWKCKEYFVHIFFPHKIRIECISDAKRMTRIAIVSHRVGWSASVGLCFALNPKIFWSLNCWVYEFAKTIEKTSIASIMIAQLAVIMHEACTFGSFFFFKQMTHTWELDYHLGFENLVRHLSPETVCWNPFQLSLSEDTE